MSSKMSKGLGVSLALTIALITIPTLTTSAYAQTASGGPVVYGDNGTVIGQDPDAFIGLMLRRDSSDYSGDGND